MNEFPGPLETVELTIANRMDELPRVSALLERVGSHNRLTLIKLFQ